VKSPHLASLAILLAMLAGCSRSPDAAAGATAVATGGAGNPWQAPEALVDLDGSLAPIDLDIVLAKLPPSLVAGADEILVDTHPDRGRGDYLALARSGADTVLVSAWSVGWDAPVAVPLLSVRSAGDHAVAVTFSDGDAAGVCRELDGVVSACGGTRTAGAAPVDCAPYRRAYEAAVSSDHGG